MSYKYSSKRKENLEQQKILLKIESEESDTNKVAPVKPPPVTPITKNPVLAVENWTFPISNFIETSLSENENSTLL